MATPRPRSATAPTVLAAGLSAFTVLGLGLIGSLTLTGANQPIGSVLGAPVTPLSTPAAVQPPPAPSGLLPTGPDSPGDPSQPAAEAPIATLAVQPPTVSQEPDPAPEVDAASLAIQLVSAPLTSSAATADQAVTVTGATVAVAPALDPLAPVVAPFTLLRAVAPPPPEEPVVGAGVVADEPAPSRSGGEKAAKPSAPAPAKADGGKSDKGSKAYKPGRSKGDNGKGQNGKGKGHENADKSAKAQKAVKAAKVGTPKGGK